MGVSSDQVAAALAPVRERSDQLGRFAEVGDIRDVAGDVPRLLAALDAALKAIDIATGTLDPEKTRAEVLAALTGGKTDG